MASQSTPQSTPSVAPSQQPEPYELLTLAEDLERYPNGEPLGTPYPQILDNGLILRRRSR